MSQVNKPGIFYMRRNKKRKSTSKVHYSFSVRPPAENIHSLEVFLNGVDLYFPITYINRRIQHVRHIERTICAFATVTFDSLYASSGTLLLMLSKRDYTYPRQYVNCALVQWKWCHSD